MVKGRVRILEASSDWVFYLFIYFSVFKSLTHSTVISSISRRTLAGIGSNTQFRETTVITHGYKTL